MTPTDFEFTVTMPGDARLVGTVRQLAAQAADYAQLTAGAGEGFAGHVARATEAAIAEAPAPPPIHVRFAGGERAIDVVISWDAAAAPADRPALATGGVTVDWSSKGSRHTCRIRQTIPA